MTEQKLILHFGFHKTGTSALQRGLFRNRKRLLETYKIFYPDTTSFEAHHAIASRLKAANKNANSLESMIKDVRRTFGLWKNEGARVTVVSSEMFSEGVDPQCLSVLSDMFDSVVIVFYIRQIDFLQESAYAQQVRQNGEKRNIGEFSPYIVNIFRHIQSFVHAIAGAQLVLREYEYTQLNEGDIVKDFFKSVLDINNFNWGEFEKVKVNKSLSAVACEALRKLNAQATSINREKMIDDLMACCEEMGRLFQVPLIGHLYTDEERVNLHQRVANQIFLLKQHFGFEFHQKVNIPRELTPSQIDLLSNTLICQLLVSHYR